VQRSETDLTLDEKDFSPEQGRDLDKRFRLTGDEGEEGSGSIETDDMGSMDQVGEQERTDDEHGQVDLESEGELGGEGLGGRPGEDIDEMEMRLSTKARPSTEGPLSKLKKKLMGKSTQTKRRDPKAGDGWSVLSTIVGIPAGFEAAYQRGGVHEIFSAMFKRLAIGEEWVRDNHLTEAEKLLDGLCLDTIKKPGLVATLLSPIVAARIAHLKALGKKLRKKIEKKKKLLGTKELRKTEETHHPEDLDTGEGLDGEQLGGGF
jgi:hypothetical protein